MIAFVLSIENGKFKIFTTQSGRSRDPNLSCNRLFLDPLYINHHNLTSASFQLTFSNQCKTVASKRV